MWSGFDGFCAPKVSSVRTVLPRCDKNISSEWRIAAHAESRELAVTTALAVVLQVEANQHASKSASSRLRHAPERLAVR